jgi:hypothetical protein
MKKCDLQKTTYKIVCKNKRHTLTDFEDLKKFLLQKLISSPYIELK